jgi:kynurenine formamidase
VNNWGRWGADDERGTLNLITPEVVARGAACVREGKPFPLALPLGPDGPQVGGVPGRINPERTMIAVRELLGDDPDGPAVSDDVVSMSLQAGTHWDALAHVTWRGRTYNGFPADSIDANGAARCGIDKVGVVAGRGILLDVARAAGVDRLAPGRPIMPEDLEAAEESAGVHVSSGDVVLIRTGHLQVFLEGRREDYPVPCPGASYLTAGWFHERDVAAVASDTFVFEVFPYERDDVRLPLHLLHLVEMGLLQGENWHLEDLAADCADDGRYAFFLEATPEPFTGALGGPVAPVAVK